MPYEGTDTVCLFIDHSTTVCLLHVSSLCFQSTLEWDTEELQYSTGPCIPLCCVYSVLGGISCPVPEAVGFRESMLRMNIASLPCLQINLALVMC